MTRAAIAGDVIGSRFERSVWQGRTVREVRCVGYDRPPRSDGTGETAASFELFHADCEATDDSFLTVAVMDWLLDGGDLRDVLREHFRLCPTPGLFGRFFREWAAGDGSGFCGSVGNGAAMRVAPVAYAADDLDTIRILARENARATHTEGDPVTGTEAIAAGVFLARTGVPREEIARQVASFSGYDLGRPLDDWRGAPFSSACAATVPVAFRAFLESDDHESAVRAAISVGGDADTTACMAGALAGAFWGVPAFAAERALAALDARQAALVAEFERRFPAALRVVG
jgi:ADP-ribosylglycohydrolase